MKSPCRNTRRDAGRSQSPRRVGGKWSGSGWKDPRDGLRACVYHLAMPEMDGWETARAHPEDSPNVKIVLVTGYGPTQCLRPAKKLVDAIIGKPLRFRTGRIDPLPTLTKTGELQMLALH